MVYCANWGAADAFSKLVIAPVPGALSQVLFGLLSSSLRRSLAVAVLIHGDGRYPAGTIVVRGDGRFLTVAVLIRGGRSLVVAVLIRSDRSLTVAVLILVVRSSPMAAGEERCGREAAASR